MASSLESNELNDLYSPNKWTKRSIPTDKIVDNHLNVTAEASEKARQEIPCQLNIPYGSMPKEKFDAFGTDLKEDAPTFILVHGGYWQKEYMRRETYHYVATNLYKKKIRSIFLGYELCPNVTLPDMVERVANGIKKCIDYSLKHGSQKIYLAGYSSGAHLVAHFFTTYFKNLSKIHQGHIRAAILLAGIYDLTDLPRTEVNVPLKLDDQMALELSPQHHLISNGTNEISSSFYVVCAENDSPVFRKQSEDFHRKLVDAEIDSNLHVIIAVDHFDLVELLVDSNYVLSKLIFEIIAAH